MQLNDGYPQSSVSTVPLPHNFDLPRSEQQWPARVCYCHFAERTATNHFTERLCSWMWIFKQTLPLMNAETCTVWRYIEFTSKGTLLLCHFLFFIPKSRMPLGVRYACLLALPVAYILQKPFSVWMKSVASSEGTCHVATTFTVNSAICVFRNVRSGSLSGQK